MIEPLDSGCTDGNRVLLQEKGVPCKFRQIFKDFFLDSYGFDCTNLAFVSKGGDIEQRQVFPLYILLTDQAYLFVRELVSCWR